MATSCAEFNEAFKSFASHDRRRVAGAFGQITLWPDEYVAEGWERRDDIRAFPGFFVGGREAGR